MAVWMTPRGLRWNALFASLFIACVFVLTVRASSHSNETDIPTSGNVTESPSSSGLVSASPRASSSQPSVYTPFAETDSPTSGCQCPIGTVPTYLPYSMESTADFDSGSASPTESGSGSAGNPFPTDIDSGSAFPTESGSGSAVNPFPTDFDSAFPTESGSGSAANPFSTDIDSGSASPTESGSGSAVNPFPTDFDSGSAFPTESESGSAANPIESGSGSAFPTESGSGSAANPFPTDIDSGSAFPTESGSGSAANPFPTDFGDGSAFPTESGSGSAVNPFPTDFDSGSAFPTESESGSAANPIESGSGSAFPTESGSGSAANPFPTDIDSGSAFPTESESGSAVNPFPTDFDSGSAFPTESGSGSAANPFSTESTAGSEAATANPFPTEFNTDGAAVTTNLFPTESTTGGATTTHICYCTPIPTPPETAEPPSLFYPFEDHYSTINLDDKCVLVRAKYSGFPYFGKRLTQLYICANGLVSGNRPFRSYTPVLLSDNRLIGFDIIAPFWADINVLSGELKYHLYHDGYDYNGILSRASEDVLQRYNLTQFDAVQVLVVTWYNVANYPDGKNYGFDELSDLRNSFQLVLATDDIQTFAFFIYGNDSLYWAGRCGGYAVSGYMATNLEGNSIDYFYNVDGSGTPEITNVLSSQLWLSFLLTPDLDSLAIKRQDCWTWYFDDIRTLGENVQWGIGEAPPCPASESLAANDPRFIRSSDLESYNCYYSVFPAEHYGFYIESVCCYVYGALAESLSSPYHRLIEPYNHTLSTVDPYFYCCEIYDPFMCHLYHERRPSIDSSGYSPTIPAPVFGDPHFETVYGFRYTFNGVGDYVLVREAMNFFTLQGRFSSVNDSSASVLTALAAALFPYGTSEMFARETPYNGVFHVELSDDDTLVVYAREGPDSEWDDITGNLSSDGSPVNVYGTILTKSSSGVVVIRFSGGIALTVEPKTGLLAAVVTAPIDTEDPVSLNGLLGNLTSRYGVVVPRNATDRQLHFDFGQTWRIYNAYDESILYNSSDANSSSSLEPLFFDEIDVSTAASSDLIALCNGSNVCLFDGIVTGNLQLANETKETEEQNAELRENLSNFPPTFSGETNLNAYVNQTSIYVFSVSDPDGDSASVTVQLKGTLPPTSDFNFTNDGNVTYTFSWRPSSTDNVSLLFFASDSRGATSLLHPFVMLCGCRLDPSAWCAYPEYSGSKDGFVLMDCMCGEGYSGRFCDVEVDECDYQECFPGVDCFDTKWGDPTCGSCPNGTHVIGDKCFDGTANCTLEVSTEFPTSFPFPTPPPDYEDCFASSNCSQACAVINETQTCFCFDGFEVDLNERDCSDIDECISSPCYNGGTCQNTDGSFYCNCSSGFVGRSCQTDIDECESYPCQNGWCDDFPGGFNCSCMSGYTGFFCETDIDECSSYPCQNGGTCVENSVPGYVCYCMPAYTGIHCETGDKCLNGTTNCTSFPPSFPPPPPLPPSETDIATSTALFPSQTITESVATATLFPTRVFSTSTEIVPLTSSLSPTPTDSGVSETATPTPTDVKTEAPTPSTSALETAATTSFPDVITASFESVASTALFPTQAFTGRAASFPVSTTGSVAAATLFPTGVFSTPAIVTSTEILPSSSSSVPAGFADTATPTPTDVETATPTPGLSETTTPTATDEETVAPTTTDSDLTVTPTPAVETEAPILTDSATPTPTDLETVSPTPEDGGETGTPSAPTAGASPTPGSEGETPTPADDSGSGSEETPTPTDEPSSGSEETPTPTDDSGSGSEETPTPETDTPTPTAPTPTPVPCELYPFDSHPWRSGFDDYCFSIYTTLTAFPYFSNRFHRIYICANGLIAFDRPFYRYRPELFSFNLIGRNIIAPFWADATIFESAGSRIYYQLYARDDGNSQTAATLAKATYDVRARLPETEQDFTAIQVLVVTWSNVANYPDGYYWYFFYGRSYDSLSNLRNTFQLILVTDSVRTYAFFVYGDNGLQWSGRWGRSGVAGYVATGANGLFLAGVSNVVGSGTPSISEVDNLIYNEVIGTQCGAFFGLSVDPQQADLNRQKCLNWFSDDIDRLGKAVTWGQGVAQSCPCSAWQVWWDFRYSWAFGFPWDELSCFYTSFPRYSGGLWIETSCCYRFGSLILSPPLSGQASPYHRRWDSTNYFLYTEEPFQFCCAGGDADLCARYFERRPPVDCTGYFPLNLCWGYGDPHLQTADGTKYTFNGRGEYVLIRGKGNGFTMQARTVPAVGSNATVFSAFVMAAFPDGTTSDFAFAVPLYGIIHTELKGNDSMTVKTRRNSSATWTDITAEYEALSENDTLDVFGSLMSRPVANELVVRYPEGMSVTVTVKKGLITAVFAGPNDQKSDETRGLLGVWDDDTSNDFTARDGTVVPTNSSDRKIHYEFGQTWQITANESLFYYSDGKGPADFSFPNHVPPFIDEADFSNVSQELRDACGDDVVCLYDGVQTGDVEVAAQTRQTETANLEQIEFLDNFPPTMHGNDTLRAFLNKAVTYLFTVSDPNDTVTIRLVGTPPPTSDFTLQLSSRGSYNFTWTPSSLSPVSLQFVANDSAGASTLLHPLVRLCGCRLDLGAMCIDATGSGGGDRFLLQTCQCGSGWDGPLCDQDEDGCADFECFEGVECIDNAPPASGASCGPCPNGSSSVNGTELCIDINECETNTSGCEQACTNLPLLSFTCSCRSGFVLNSDGRTCDDINECATSRPCHQICSNTEGSFRCSCEDGFLLDSDGATCIANETCSSSDCEQVCAVIKGTQTCSCNRGFELKSDGKNCQDIDECADINDNDCDDLCVNTNGSFTCDCSSGYQLNSDGRTCDDINECLVSLPICPGGQQCANTEGSFTCSCAGGLELINGSCQVPFTPTASAAPTALATSESTTSKAPNASTPTAAATSSSAPTVAVTPTLDSQLPLVTATLRNVSLAQFDRTLFVESVISAFTLYCNSDPTACSSGSRRRRDTPTIDVVIVNVAQKANSDLDVTFYVSLGDQALPADVIIAGLNTTNSTEILKSSGFTVLEIVSENPPATPSKPAPSTPASTGEKGGLSDADIVGIVVGTVGGIVFLVMLIIVIYWIVQSKKSAKVLPHDEGQEMGLMRSSKAKKGRSSPDMEECQLSALKNCSYGCILVNKVETCLCGPGFQLSEEERTCKDVDECQASLDNCQQVCNNTWGDYLCHCTAGYSLNPDGRSCDAQPTYPENRLVVIVLQISTVAEFDESLFREAIALAISEYCDSIGAACFASNRARRLATLTKDKVVIVNVTSEDSGLSVVFYVLSGIEGAAVPRDTIIQGLSTAKAIEQLQDFGFSVLNFQSTTTATGLITIAPFGGFSAGKIVGVVLGTLGGIGLLIVSIVAFYWV